MDDTLGDVNPRGCNSAQHLRLGRLGRLAPPVQHTQPGQSQLHAARQVHRPPLQHFSASGIVMAGADGSAVFMTISRLPILAGDLPPACTPAQPRFLGRRHSGRDDLGSGPGRMLTIADMAVIGWLTLPDGMTPCPLPGNRTGSPRRERDKYPKIVNCRR
jgi:hypothetical protein